MNFKYSVFQRGTSNAAGALIFQSSKLQHWNFSQDDGKQMMLQSYRVRGWDLNQRSFWIFGEL